MSEKELTYVLDEETVGKELEGKEIVGYICVPVEFSDKPGPCCTPITAAAMAEIERNALKGETEREVDELRTKLLVKLVNTMVAEIAALDPVTRDSQGT